MSLSEGADADATVHRALASPSRAALVRYLARDGQAATVDALAAATGLHRNTVRDHLAVLEDAQVVECVGRTETAARGRPAHRYRLCSRSEPASADAMAMTAIIATGFGVDADAAVKDAMPRAYAWGAARAQRLRAQDPVAAVSEVLASAGGTTSHDDACVHVHQCPFADAARVRPEIVCAIHEAMLRGVVSKLPTRGARVAVRSPRGPGSCVVHVTEAGPQGGTIVPKKSAARPVT